MRIQPSAHVMQLMEKTEEMIESMSSKAGKPIQFQIQVLWNLKNSKKALSPSSLVGDHFKESGETFGIYGDQMPVEPERSQIPESEKIPVTILTGFLGAGKTTLLNYVLQEQTEQKIAVIENEFGPVSIDDALLKKEKIALAEKVVVMDNGCMCCTVRGDLITGLMSILEEVKKGNQVDAIMIETTGMADPVPIVRTFMTSEEITDELRLDGVITVADAKHIIARLDDEVEEGKVNEAYQQIAFCDKILLNKLDLVEAEIAIKVKDRLRSINSFAKILPCTRSRVRISELTDLRAHDMRNFANIDLEKEAEDVQIEGHGEDHGHGGHGAHGHDEGHGHGHGHGHDENCTEDHGHGESHISGHGSGHGHVDAHGHVVKKGRHDSRVNSFAVVREGEILPTKLRDWMQTLGQLPASKGTIFRIKAILAIKGHPYKHVFHAVMDVSDEDDAEPWGQDEKRVSKIVFIGKGMDRDFLEEGFHNLY